MRKNIFTISLGCIVLFSLNFKIDTTHSIPEMKIGSQICMAKNLDVYTFQNGDSLNHAENPSKRIT